MIYHKEPNCCPHNDNDPTLTGEKYNISAHTFQHTQLHLITLYVIYIDVLSIMHLRLYCIQQIILDL